MAEDNAVDYVVGHKRPPKEYQFKKGQSGNPGGRAKILSATYHRLLHEVDPADERQRTRAELVALALIKKAQGGDVQAIKELGDRLEGKPRQTISLTNDRREQLEAQIEQFIEDAAALDPPEHYTREEAIRLLKPTAPELEYFM